jgi:hypothetical protein
VENRSAPDLESFGQFFRECAVRPLWSLLSIGAVGTLVLSATAFTPWTGWRSSPIHLTGLSWTRTWALAFGPGRLGLISPKKPVFQGRTVKTADDQVHFFRVGRVDKCKPFGLLGLRIADHLHVVVDEVFCVKPGLDVVLGNPDGQISEEHCETHSVVSLTPFLGIVRNCFADAIHES